MVFENALDARIPVIGVTTDDYVNFEHALQLLAKLPVKELPKSFKNLAAAIYWTDDESLITVDVYRALVETEHQVIVLNPAKKSPLIFDGGILPTPKVMITEYLSGILDTKDIEPVYEVLKGLSLKAASEVVMLTQARTKSNSLKELRRTRTMLGGNTTGLVPVDTEFDFYKFPPKLEDWLKVNKDYFLKKDVHPKLRPRGVMLEGFPGVGKSLAAKAIAKALDAPLYRLDVATTLNKYIGESEARVARILSMLEREAPCVMLLDEVEKIFTDKEDSGVTTRIMAQLLWWLADHQSQVLTVMTTNNLTNIPPELYRPGRVDMVMRIPRLSIQEAITFSQDVFFYVTGKKAAIKQVSVLSSVVKATNKDEFAHSEVADLVYFAIKEHGWA